MQITQEESFGLLKMVGSLVAQVAARDQEIIMLRTELADRESRDEDTDATVSDIPRF